MSFAVSVSKYPFYSPYSPADDILPVPLHAVADEFFRKFQNNLDKSNFIA